MKLNHRLKRAEQRVPVVTNGLTLLKMRQIINAGKTIQECWVNDRVNLAEFAQRIHAQTGAGPDVVEVVVSVLKFNPQIREERGELEFDSTIPVEVREFSKRPKPVHV